MARRGARQAMTTATGVKALKVSADAAKYTGYEPEWVDVKLPEDLDERRALLVKTFNWYNYQFNSKEALAMMIDYLAHESRNTEAKQFKKVSKFPNAVVWLARMSMVGWELNEEEQASIDLAVNQALEAVQAAREEVSEEEKPKAKKPNVQEIMRERAAEAGGELEGLLDEYIKDGAKTKHNIQPIHKLKAANILPQHVSPMVEHWKNVAQEYTDAHAGKDADLVEAYGHLSKVQLRNLAKFADLVVADLNSYVTFKKASKAPRKKKQKTPLQLVQKLKYMKEFPELKLTSEKPTKIIEAKEMFAYSTKKRKLQYYVADEHAGNALMVKNNTIVGFDPTKSIQKTLRKPVDQMKEFMKSSKPNSRKFFANIKAVETKMSGRFADDIVILKVW